MKNINLISFQSKRVLIRVDFNVPLDRNLNITDDSRIIAALPTIKKVISDGGKAIIISHLGRPKNGFEEKFSLKHIVLHLSKLLNKDVGFSLDCIGKNTISDISKMKNGEVLVLENLRFHSEEKKGDKNFARQLSSLADIYINDAFGVSHRPHTSTSTICDFFPKNKHFGFLLVNEIKSLKKVLNKPERPFTAIIGGAKITGKIDVINALFEKVDNLIIGGGMAYTFAKAMGGSVGKSIVEDKKIPLAKKIIKDAKKNSVNLFLPIDSINADSFNNEAKTNISDILDIIPGFMGLDIGEKSVKSFSEIINISKTIIWNGPMGVFEMSKFEKGTKKIATAICKATENGAFSLVGGGDSVAAIKKFGFEEKISYISTGGGAMLNYLEGKKLPGIVAIDN